MTRSTRPLILAAAALVLGTSAAAQETSLTIFQDGRVLVRRTFPVELPAGRSSHSLAVDPLDPTSVVSLAPGVRIEGMRYRPASDGDAALRAALGKAVRFVSEDDTVTATVVSVDPPQFRLADGSIAFGLPGRPEFSADLVSASPILEVDAVADRAGRDLALAYVSHGASWNAGYQVVLGAGDARVSGWAAIEPGRLGPVSASVQLLAGDIGRARDEPAVRRGLDAGYEAVMVEAVPSAQAVGDVHVYSLPGTVALTPGTGVSQALFAVARADYERSYVLEGALPWVGPVHQVGDQEQRPVTVAYRVARSRGSEFGDRPLPAGIVRLFRLDDSDRLQLIGESSIDHTPAGQPLELDAGTAFDLTARRVQTEYRIQRDSLTTTTFAEYRITISNASDSAATVEVRERRRGDWEVLSSSLPADRVSSTLVRFRAPVPARGEAALTYRVRARW